MSWEDYRVFLAAYRTGSLGRTADALAVSLSTASRRLATFEEQLGAPLFARTPSGLEPLTTAHALLPHAEAVERAALAGQAAVRSLDPEPRGEVRIGVPADMLLLVVFPRLRPLLERFPDLTLVFDSGSQSADLARREADIAVRLTRPSEGEELVSRRVREVRMAFYAHRSLLEGVDPSDPMALRWVGWVRQSPVAAPLDGICGGRYAVRVEDPVSLRHAVQAGLGATLLPITFALAVPDLVRLPYPAPPPIQLHLITHRAVRTSPRVRAVWEALEGLLVAGDFDEDVATIRDSASRTYGWGP